MNKFPLLIAVIVSFQLLTVPLQASSVEMSVGGTFLYNCWDPAWNNGKLILYTPNRLKIPDSSAPRYEPIQSYDYGPDLTLRFLRNVEIAAAFRYGHAVTSGTSLAVIPNMGYRKISIEYDLYDIHARAGYYLLDFLMPYAGLSVELLRHNIEFNQVNIVTLDTITHASMEGEILKFTPEIGLHFTVPVTSFLSFMFDLSGTFQSGSDKIEYKNMCDAWELQFNYPPIAVSRYYALGCSTSAAFRMTIPKINTSVSLGGHYRLLRYMQKTKDQGMFNLDGSFDHTYGITCSAAYTFSFGNGKGKHVWIPRPAYPAR